MKRDYHGRVAVRVRRVALWALRQHRPALATLQDYADACLERALHQSEHQFRKFSGPFSTIYIKQEFADEARKYSHNLDLKFGDVCSNLIMEGVAL